jgi:cytochrome b561
MSSAAHFCSFLNLFTLPDFVPPDSSVRWLQQIHDGLGYAMTVAIGLHAGAALRHHFLLHDDTLRKMLPGM